MILNFTGFELLNESFKSSVISNLFKDGELKVVDDKDKALFNQVKDDEVIGIADTKEDAKKMLYDALGDRNETRYKLRRIYFRVSRDDYDEDFIEDPDSAYNVNTTVEEYERWVFELTSGKFLVLAIDKNELEHRYYQVTGKRWENKRTHEFKSELKRKFEERKKFVETHKEDIEKYKEMKQYFVDKGIWDDFVKLSIEKLDEFSSKYLDSDKFTENVYDYEGRDFDDETEMEFEFGEYNVDILVNFTVCYDYDYIPYDKGDYWTHPSGDEYEIQSASLDADNIHIYITSKTDDAEFDFDYDPLFDKNNMINFS